MAFKRKIKRGRRRTYAAGASLDALFDRSRPSPGGGTGGFHVDALQRRDPTGTGSIRRRWRSLSDQRWREVQVAVRTAVQAQDILGLNPASASAIALAVSMSRDPVGIAVGSMAAGTGDAKVRAFQSWLDTTLLQLITGPNDGWLRPMVAAAYARGVTRAQRLTGTLVIPPDMDARINTLTALAFVELQGVAEAVSQRAVREVTEGLLTGMRAPEVVRRIQAAISAIGRVRSRAVIETLVVKAFTFATVDTFRVAGVRQVGMLPEMVPVVVSADAEIADAPRKRGPGSRGGRSRRTVRRIRRVSRTLRARLGERVNVLTAGDDRVCPICEDLEGGGPYDLDTALSLIPAHPNCRCALIPADDEVDVGDAFDPNQPRDPAGTSTGGRWRSEGGEPPMQPRGAGELTPEELQALVDKVAKKLDIDPSLIEISEGEHVFELNGENLSAAGVAYSAEGRIVLFRKNLFYGPDNVEGVLAHEIAHVKFQKLINDFGKEREVLFEELKKHPPESFANRLLEPMKPDGTLREGLEGRWAERFPLYNAYTKTTMDIAKMIDEDGVSHYSRKWWEAVRGHTANTHQGFHETIAEMMRLHYQTGKIKGPAIIKKGGERSTVQTSKEWAGLYRLTVSNWAAKPHAMRRRRKA